ncbi:hypothetical protein MASR1M60_17950 [Rhodocyclaceae bacterium]
MIGKKIPNKHPKSTKATRIRRLTNYLRAPENERAEEKCLYSKGRGFLSETPEGQTLEMIALAEESVKSKDPINHYVISWREGEIPTRDQIEKTVDTVLDELGLAGHQVIYGLHADTDNHHLHLAVNRVPDTLKAVEINKGFDIEKLHQAIARVEHAQGWQREVERTLPSASRWLCRVDRKRQEQNEVGSKAVRY